MKRHCLFIDDDNEFESVLERLPEIAKKTRGIDLTYDFISIDESFLNENNDIVIAKIEEAFINRIKENKYDFVACDFDLGDDSIFGTDLIKTFRQRDRKFIAAIYSANLARIVRQIIESHNPNDFTLTLNKVTGLVTSNITRFFEKSRNLMEDITPLVCDVSIEKKIEEVLLDYKKLTLEHGFGLFKGMPLGEIANQVRQQTDSGKKFIEEVVERGITHFIDLNK